MSTFEKSGLSKIPWLESNRKTTNEDKSLSHGNLPDFINQQRKIEGNDNTNLDMN